MWGGETDGRSVQRCRGGDTDMCRVQRYGGRQTGECCVQRCGGLFMHECGKVHIEHLPWPETRQFVYLRDYVRTA